MAPSVSCPGHVESKWWSEASETSSLGPEPEVPSGKSLWVWSELILVQMEAKEQSLAPLHLSQFGTMEPVQHLSLP